MKRIKILILLILIISTNTILVAQRLAVLNLSNNDGLASNDVYTILQDKLGFIWFGTQGGLSRFDGLKFITYTTGNGLPNVTVKNLIQSKNGDIWITTLGGGICRFDGKEFHTINKESGLCNNYAFSAIEDRNGGFWFGTEGGGVSNYKDGKFKTYTTNDGLGNNVIRSILQDSRNRIWFSHSIWGGGVSKYENNKFTTLTTKDGLLSNNVIAIFEDSKKNIWFGTDIGISVYDGTTFHNFNESDGLPEQAILSITEDKTDGSMWVGTNGGGLIRFVNNKFKIFTTKDGLSSDKIYTILQDLRGDLWLGTALGIDHIGRELFLTYTNKNGLTDFDIFAICEGTRNEMWLGSEGSGVYVVSNGSIKNYSKENGLPDNNVSSIFNDKKGNIWIGTTKGLCKYNSSGFTKYTIKDGLPDNYIFAICGDNEGNLWIGTNNGLCKYDYKKFVTFRKKDGLIDDKIIAILLDQTGELWFASYLNGISRYSNGKFININPREGSPNGILYMTKDHLNYIWVCSETGLYRYDHNSFNKYTTKEGLKSNIVTYIIDDNNYYYIGTLSGIHRIKVDDILKNSYLNCILYNYKSGLPGTEGVAGSVARDSEGKLWFGTKRGLTIYDPANNPILNHPNIHITRVKVKEKERDPFSLGTIDYSQNRLDFDFFAADYHLPEHVIYEYMLEGLDTSWIKTEFRTISYPYLPDGNYKFKVKVRNSDGIWSNADVVVPFTITAPYYKTIWFMIASVLTLLYFVYLIYKYKTNQVQKRNIELGIMVRERTKELEDEKNKSDELLQNILPVSTVTELKSKGFVQPREIKNISILFTDFKGFTYIAGMLPAEKLVNELNEIFKGFDEIIESHGVEKLKTIGDSYMIGAGLPEEAEDHAIKVIKVAREMLDYITERNKTSAIKWEMRAGIHSGTVIAGVVGKKKFSYDIWGDTVNIASRMESAGSPGEINISAYTYMLVKDFFDCEYRGKVTAKGKGELDMYFIKGPKSFQHDLFQQKPEVN